MLTVGVADLIETGVSIKTASPVAAGGTIQVGDTVTNQGGSLAAASVTQFYLSTNGVAKTLSLGSRSAVQVAGNGNDGGATTTVTLPLNITGAYYVVACANSTNTVLESNYLQQQLNIDVGDGSLSGSRRSQRYGRKLGAGEIQRQSHGRRRRARGSRRQRTDGAGGQKRSL
jgi:CARDB